MANQPSDLAVLGQGIAVVATCIVQELAKSDPTFQERFLRRLGEAYHELRDNSEHDPLIALGVLASTRSLLTGFDHVNGQREPFLSGRLDD